ncbi:MAG TPA: hypothetical protein DHN33_09875, partial [Eubacteriaceae bacterium]|nr:hypothetical protein [Eubacteriaceae bacterium]
MNENYRTFRYTAIDHEESIKGYLKEKEAYSERLLRDIKREGQCYIDGVKTRINSPLRKEEILTVVLPEEAIDAEPENQDISIVYEDDDLLVVNKKEGQVTHPTRR